MLDVSVADAFGGPGRGAAGYLNTASLGLPVRGTLGAITAHLAAWSRGESEPPTFDDDVDRSRLAYARIVGVDPDAVAIAAQVSVVSGFVAASLPDGARVVCAEEDFTSVLYPFLVDGRLDVRVVPLERVLDEVHPGVDLVAVSAVQSADGRRIDLDALAASATAVGARTYVDVTQAAGWTVLDAGRFDVTACGAYKWLCCPRGAAFMTVGGSAGEWLVPRAANWYAGIDRWGASIYGPHPALAPGARRFDTSPAWIAWVGAAPAVELLAEIGPRVIGDHDVALADALCDRLGLPRGGSAIVSLEERDGDADALAAAGIRFARRAGRIRLSFHLYNADADVDRVVDALEGRATGAAAGSGG